MSTTVTGRGSRRVDPISLEVLRNRLEAIGDEAAKAIERTAISPVVTESKDYSCTLIDADGGVIAGAGRIEYHFGAAAHAVRSTIARFGHNIEPGDVFIANDPHNGGGLHAQDVMIQRPVFVQNRRVAWIVNSAHMMDLGGMAPGSFAPTAVECYQEALRLPPVRLFAAGVECTDVWDIFRNNVRLADLVEMDMRSLVAGCHVANEKIVGVAESMGVDEFIESVDAICDLSERELRRRIDRIADGEYRAVSWTEWENEFFVVPCTLTVDGGRLVFDYEGASPQTNHFFNSKPFIIQSELVADICQILAQDLPHTRGVFAPIELRCPEGTIVNSQPPAPVAAAHMHVALNAATVGLQCLLLALGASPDAPARKYFTGWTGTSALAVHTWSGSGIDGNPEAWIMLDGNWVGAPAAAGRDGLDLFTLPIGSGDGVEFTDIEILESWYPILIKEKRPRPGVNGAGEHRSGGGCQMTYQPHGTERLSGVMLGMRRWLPLPGAAGGFPGANTRFRVLRGDGTTEDVATNASGVDLGVDDLFQFCCASGGGFGDPLDRDPEAVLADVEFGRLTVAEANEAYGVVVADGLVSARATQQRRRRVLRRRLEASAPPLRPLTADDVAGRTDGDPLPLYPGIEQRGSVACSVRTGTPLAVAPDHFTDGCRVLEERWTAKDAPVVVTRAYLDPTDGRALYVEAVPEGAPRSFDIRPARWTAG